MSVVLKIVLYPSEMHELQYLLLNQLLASKLAAPCHLHLAVSTIAPVMPSRTDSFG